MSSIRDAHVVRGLLGAATALVTAALLGLTQPGAHAEPTPSISAAPVTESFAFRPLQTPALMAAAVPTGQFEDLWTPIAPPPAPQPLLMDAMDIPMIDVAATLDAFKQEPFETGIASTYGVGDGFQGNRTACGQIFNTHVVQVAHKTLKCGTLLRIEDAETGKSIVAEVTDRGPYIRGRIVDLSWAAFRELEPSGGLRPVKVYLVD